MNKKNSIIILISVFIGILLLLANTKTKLQENINTFYQVYLNGEKIGIINKKEELYELIDNNQSSIKNEYSVKNVYPPTDLKIVPINSYVEVPNKVEDVYKLIEAKDDFTIKGYKVTIRGEDDAYTINVLKKEVFYDAAKRFVQAFLDQNEYEKYINNEQEEIVETGRIIKDMKFLENISIKEDYLSVNEKIYTEEQDLSHFLLFGSNPENEEYTVKVGDTIKSVSEDNKLSVEEFLIANANYKSENNLLRVGDKVNVTLIDPQLTFIYDLYEVYNQVDYYSKETKEDSSKNVGFSEITTRGQNGLIRFSETYTVTNGVRPQGAEPVVEEVLLDTINQVTTIGTRNPDPSVPINPVVIEGNWGWPTNKGYVITSPRGWRWGRLHAGIDISGAGNYNSPIYAAADGVVIYTYNGCPSKGGYLGNTCGGGLGNQIKIDHENGYTSRYGHMTSNIKVKVGDRVKKGQIIGYMGSSGDSSGTHLHYEVAYNNATFDPLELYR